MAIEPINLEAEYRQAQNVEEVPPTLKKCQDPYLPEPLAHLENEKIWVCFDLSPQSDGKIQSYPSTLVLVLLQKLMIPIPGPHSRKQKVH